MKDDAIYYEELAIGAEFLADHTANGERRTEHLKMAGVYWRRAMLAGGEARIRVTH